MTLTVTFALGTDLDNAQVQVQNRVAQALPRLPQEVQRIGVTTEKASPDFLHGRASRLAGRALRHALPVELRLTCRSRTNWRASPASAACRSSAPANTACASGSTRTAWPSRQLTATDVVRAIREQNVQVAAGVLGAPPAPSDTTFQLSVNAQGRLSTEEEFARHRRSRHARRTDHQAHATSPASSSARTCTRCAACSTTSRRLPSASRSGRARTRSRRQQRCARRWSG